MDFDGHVKDMQQVADAAAFDGVAPEQVWQDVVLALLTRSKAFADLLHISSCVKLLRTINRYALMLLNVIVAPSLGTAGLHPIECVAHPTTRRYTAQACRFLVANILQREDWTCCTYLEWGEDFKI